jgi:hypothetical protein
MRFARAIGGLALAVALLAPAAARADIFAAVGVTGSDGSPDVAVMNATTGGRLALPAGVNTAAQELQPSISVDGTRMAFLRLDPAAGTTRVIVTDLVTGRSADLFNGFEVAQRAPSDPEMAPNGRRVFTAGPFGKAGDNFFHDIEETELQDFPGGPFPRQTVPPEVTFATTGRTTHPSAGANSLLAYSDERPGEHAVVLSSERGDLTLPLHRDGEAFSQPALPATAAAEQMLFVDRPLDTKGVAGKGDIVFGPTAIPAFYNTPIALPAIVNSADESLPAFSPDGRYVGFVRRALGRDRLLVWDSQTQTLLNPTGIDLGPLATGETGNLSLYFRPNFAATAVNTTGAVTATLLQASGVGLFVQRIVGRHRVLGRRAFKLRTVGRVPLGSFRRGHLRKHWNLRVTGRRLRPGRYLVTVRAVTRKRVVRELGRPHVLRIRRR